MENIHKMALDALSPIYFPNEDDLDKELFYPIFDNSKSCRCMIGYFTSGALSELALSISNFLSMEGADIKFIVSPNLEGKDIEAIKVALNTDKNLIPLLFPGIDISEKTLKTRAVEALSYLIAIGKVEIRIALMDEGLFHTKTWLFDTEFGRIAVHGSGNATGSGLSINFEQLTLSREWISKEAGIVVSKLDDRFHLIWGSQYEGLSTYSLNEATLSYLSEIYNNMESKNAPEIERQLKELFEKEKYHDNHDIQSLKVPSWLNYTSGEFKHQGKAVEAWNENNRRGILAIATGGGKTLTSLVAASLVNQIENIFVIVAVPTTALINQWASDVKSFSVNPINAYKKKKSDIKRDIKKASRNLRLGVSKAEVIILTHDALKSDVLDVFEELSKKVRMMLIGDEVHNLGSTGFQDVAPEYFDYRLGLSATHERQFDEEGTEFLIDYFGEVVFEFSLRDAIGVCLVPYEYYVHEVYLTAEEEDEFMELTHKIKKLSYALNLSDGDPDKERWKLLCLSRRRIIESAQNKVNGFKDILPERADEIKRTLVFCTDKYPKQLKEVNNVLDDKYVKYHQVTSEETANPNLLNNIISAFNSGELQVLTSKRVLDEGFNVPQTEIAYIIASNTIKRQWVQRLGRVLRLSPNTNKDKAIIHDFMVLPNISDEVIDDDLKTLLMSEYRRLAFFSELSSNGLEEGGSFYKIKQILDLVKKDEHIV